MLPPGLRMRQARERLGLTYRDVEKASLEIAVKRARPEFILHISRLADIENRNVVPTLHKLYSIAVIYHLGVSEISGWYEAPFQQTFQDGTSFPSPRTHLTDVPVNFAPKAAHFLRNGEAVLDSATTGLLQKLPPGLAWSLLDSDSGGRFRCGYIGLNDRRMAPLLRPGSIVLVDTQMRRVEPADWTSEYDRPMYFIELREGYRCGWFYKDGSQLTMQPHPLSHCAPEAWRTPEEAELVGRVVGIISYLNESPAAESATMRPERQCSSGIDL